MNESRTWLFERGVLFALDVNDANPLVWPRIPAVFGEVGPGDVTRLARAMGASDALLIPERLATRRRCFAAWVGEQIAAYGWVSQTSECIGEHEREIRLGPREAYIWDCATLPEYRGQRLYSALLSYIAAVLNHEGIQRAWIGTSTSNLPSLNGFANAGFQPIITLLSVRFAEIHFCLAVGCVGAPGALVDAARRALKTGQEHAWGPLFVGWSPIRPATPCAQAQT